MLIPDLLNILFDQSDYKTIIMLSSLHKRKTTYACKYSLLSRYGQFDKNKDMITEYQKVVRHIVDELNLTNDEAQWGICRNKTTRIITSLFNKKNIVIDGKKTTTIHGNALQWSTDSSRLHVEMKLIYWYLCDDVIEK